MAGYRNRQARARAAFIAKGGATPTPTPTPGVSTVRVVPLLGQSNMCGRGFIDPALDTDQANVKQYANYASDTATYRKIIDSTHPLLFPEGNSFSAPNQSKGSGDEIGKRIAAVYPNDIVLLVPCAWGNTSLLNPAANSAPNAPQWGVGNSLYLNAITRTNEAISAAQAAYPGATIVLHSMYWIQGEADGTYATTQQYLDALTATIAGFRSGITGAASAPFIIGGMLPEGIIGHPGYELIEAAHRQAVTAVAGVQYINGPIGFDRGDNLHYAAGGHRLLGPKMAAAGLGIPSVSFRNVAISQNEGNGGTTTAYTYTVERSTGVGAATAPITFSTGSTDASDYVGGVLPSGLQAVFANGVTTATVTVNVAGDNVLEGDEAFSLSLTAPSGYEVGTRPSATGALLNDDTSGGTGTNLIAAPRAFDTWGGSSLIVSPNVANDPVSGTATADRIAEQSGVSVGALASPTAGAGSFVAGQQYTIAVDAKFEDARHIQLYFASAVFGSTGYANFDIQSGTVAAKGSTATASVLSLGNGWFRCILTLTASANGACQLFLRPCGTAGGGRGTAYTGTGQAFLAANAQIVTGAVANAY